MPELKALDTGLDNAVLDRTSERLADDLRHRLPRVLRSAFDDPQAPLLREAAAMLAPGTAAISAAEDLFDPITAPNDVLPWLAHWFGWGHLFHDPQDPRRRLTRDEAFPPGADRLRDLLVAFPYVQSLQGRQESLAETLRIATGRSDIHVTFREETQDVWVEVPQDLAPMRPWLLRMIHEERPAHLTVQVQFGPLPAKGQTP